MDGYTTPEHQPNLNNQPNIMALNIKVVIFITFWYLLSVYISILSLLKIDEYWNG